MGLFASLFVFMGILAGRGSGGGARWRTDGREIVRNPSEMLVQTCRGLALLGGGLVADAGISHRGLICQIKLDHQERSRCKRNPFGYRTQHEAWLIESGMELSSSFDEMAVPSIFVLVIDTVSLSGAQRPQS